MMYRILTAFLCFGSLNISAANESQTEKTNFILCAFEQGNLVLENLLEICPSFANATTSNKIHPDSLGKVIDYNGTQYEIRVLSFEDTIGNLSAETTFIEYATQNGLLEMQSHKVYPLPGLCFESFDFRHAKLEDGVYFSIVLRQIEG